MAQSQRKPAAGPAKKKTTACRDGKPHWFVRSGTGLRCKICKKRKTSH